LTEASIEKLREMTKRLLTEPTKTLPEKAFEVRRG